MMLGNHDEQTRGAKWLGAFLLIVGLSGLAGLGGGCAPRVSVDSSSEGESLLPPSSWDIVYVSGAKVGYAHTEVATVSEEGTPVVKIDSAMHVIVKRFNDTSRQSVLTTTWETPAGRLLRFSSEVRQGPVPIVAQGQVEAGQLVVTTNVAGREERKRMAWPDEAGGFSAVEQSLRRQPLQPGEQRRLIALLPMVNEPGQVELRARDYEATTLMTGSYELLRVEQRVKVAEIPPLESILWVDRTGDVLKVQMVGIDQVIYRGTETLAKADDQAAGFDLGWASTVRIKGPIPDAHQSRSARYRVQVREGDPVRLFAAGVNQSVKPLGQHEAELIVRALRPETPRAPQPNQPADLPTESDRGPTSLVQSDDPRVVALAREGAGDATDPWDVATRLESFVRRTIQQKNFSQAFATASEVAVTREGDCTEHAVLLTALCRARGIPARAALGLVYIDSVPGFGFHMWTEAYIGEQWIPLDGTLGMGGIGAGHLKIGHSSLSGPQAFLALVPVGQLLGQLQIEVIGVAP